jgi:uncharacterized membrane protein YhaH (DUF805 family)
MNYLIDPYKKMFDYTGISGRKEFWLFFIFTLLISVAMGYFRSTLQLPSLLVNLLQIIIIIIPTYALGFRRLKDAGFTKWLFLIPFVNLVLASFPSKNRSLSNNDVS